MRSKTADRILKNMSLEIRLKVITEMSFINLITDLGYRKDMMWVDGDEYDDKLLLKLLESAKTHTSNIIKEMHQWEKDGRPMGYEDKELLKIYMDGFNDELNGLRRNQNPNPLLNRAYNLGMEDAMIGDDVSSSDMQSDKEIINRIRNIDKT